MNFETVSGRVIAINVKALDHIAVMLRPITTGGGATVAAGARVHVSGSGRIIYVRAEPCDVCGQRSFSCTLRTWEAARSFALLDPPDDKPHPDAAAVERLRRCAAYTSGDSVRLGDVAWPRDTAALREAIRHGRESVVSGGITEKLAAAAAAYLDLLALSPPVREATLRRLRLHADGGEGTPT